MITIHGKLITISCLLVGIWGSSRICRAERHQEKNFREQTEKEKTELNQNLIQELGLAEHMLLITLIQHQTPNCRT
jgi:hypothetical protein